MNLYNQLSKNIPPFNPESAIALIEALESKGADDASEVDDSVLIHLLDDENFEIAISKLTNIRHILYLIFVRLMWFVLEDQSNYSLRFKNLASFDPSVRAQIIMQDCILSLPKVAHVLPTSLYSDWNGDYNDIISDKSPEDIWQFFVADIELKFANNIYNILKNTANKNIHEKEKVQASSELDNSVLPQPIQIKKTKRTKDLGLEAILTKKAYENVDLIFDVLKIESLKTDFNSREGVTAVSYIAALKQLNYFSREDDRVSVYFAFWKILNPSSTLSRSTFNKGKVIINKSIFDRITEYLVSPIKKLPY